MTGTPPARRELDVEAYHRTAEVGILAPDERVEPIDGEILQIVPVGSEHASVASTLVQRSIMALRERAGVTGSIPRRIDPRNEPWPDLRVPRPRPDRHREPPAGPPDVRLAADVPKSSLDDARSVTAPLFAAAGVDLADLSR